MSLSPHAAATRLRLLDAARDCFAERGYAATTLRDIARRAELTQPLIHHYFGSKQALFEAVLDHAFDQYEEAQAEQWELEPGDLRFATRGLVVLFWWMGDNMSLLRLGAWARLAGYEFERSRSDQIAERVRAQFEALKSKGVVRVDVDTDMALVMIDAMFRGFWERSRDFASGLSEDIEVLGVRFLEQTLEVLFRGLFAPEAAQEALAQVELRPERA